LKYDLPLAYGTTHALLTGESINDLSGQGENMNQQVSIVYLTERIPMARNLVSLDMGKAIGEKYCDRHNLIVLENSEDEIKIILSKDNLFCIDELRKVLPKEKRINAMLVDKEEIVRLFTRIYDLFGANYSR